MRLGDSPLKTLYGLKEPGATIDLEIHTQILKNASNKVRKPGTWSVSLA